MRGVQSIKNASPNMFTLIAIGTSAAYLFSVVALFLQEQGVFMEKVLNFTLFFYRKKLSFNVESKFKMIHQSKCFVCPGQNYGIS